MPPRASWKGFLNLSLVSVPVKAYTATNTGGQIRLNQLHSVCNSRIKQPAMCSVCGEIPRDEIVKGYEYAKDQYVVLDLKELDKLRSEDEGRAIRIDAFIRPEAIDPVHYSDSNYYLVPDGPAGQKSYALFHQAMARESLHCVARVVLHNKEQLVLVRPLERLLCMTVLKYTSQVKLPAAFDDELAEAEVSDTEYELARTLVEQTTVAEFDLSSYKDEYTDKLTQLIEKKVAGEEIIGAPAVESGQVISLMDALKASVEQAASVGENSPVKVGGTRKRKAVKKKTATAARKKAAAQKSQLSELLAEELAKPKRKTPAKRKKKSG